MPVKHVARETGFVGGAERGVPASFASRKIGVEFIKLTRRYERNLAVLQLGGERPRGLVKAKGKDRGIGIMKSERTQHGVGARHIPLVEICYVRTLPGHHSFTLVRTLAGQQLEGNMSYFAVGGTTI